MAGIFEKVKKGKRIPPTRRILSPLISAAASLFVPGLAQVLNGQTAKGLCILITAFAAYSLLLVNTPVFTILLYMIMIVSSSDAYFIATRMKQGEEVSPWSILFLDIHAPTANGTAQNSRAARTLITDAAVIDGTGAPPFYADVLLENGVIRCVRRHLERKENVYRIISGQGKILMPGLIAPYAQNENAYFSEDTDTAALRCGFTTEILGGKGVSRAPVSQQYRSKQETLWDSVYGKPEKYTLFANTGEYLMEMDRQIRPVQTESMLGYSTLRTNVAGLCETMPGTEQMEKILGRIRSGARSGVCGVSLNLTGKAGPVIGKQEAEAVLRVCAEERLPVSVITREEPAAKNEQLQVLRDTAEKTGAVLLFPEESGTQTLAEMRAQLQNGTLPAWVAQHTMAMAARFGLYDRGIIREGMSADLLLVRPQALPDSDMDTIRGLEKVWVKGELQYDTEPALDPSTLPARRMFGVRIS